MNKFNSNVIDYNVANYDTENGFPVFKSVQIARTGIQNYRESEIVSDGDDNKVVRVLRPRGEVMDIESVKSLANIPLVVEHPNEFVSLDNHKELSVGEVTNTRANKAGNYILADIIVRDKRVMKLIDSGKKELSVGYTCEYISKDSLTADEKKRLADENGVTDDDYDFIQTVIRGNHLALVDSGRCGSTCSTTSTSDKKTTEGLAMDAETQKRYIEFLKYIKDSNKTTKATDFSDEQKEKLVHHIHELEEGIIASHADSNKSLAELKDNFQKMDGYYQHLIGMKDKEYGEAISKMKKEHSDACSSMQAKFDEDMRQKDAAMEETNKKLKNLEKESKKMHKNKEKDRQQDEKEDLAADKMKDMKKDEEMEKDKDIEKDEEMEEDKDIEKDEDMEEDECMKKEKDANRQQGVSPTSTAGSKSGSGSDKKKSNDSNTVVMDAKMVNDQVMIILKQKNTVDKVFDSLDLPKPAFDADCKCSMKQAFDTLSKIPIADKFMKIALGSKSVDSLDFDSLSNVVNVGLEVKQLAFNHANDSANSNSYYGGRAISGDAVIIDVHQLISRGVISQDKENK